MLFEGFTGGTYKALSSYIAADQAINVYTETRDVPGSAKQATLYGTPGLKRFLTVASIGGRGWFSQDGQTWTVVGDTLYEIDVETETATSRGTVQNDGTLCSFASNGQGGDQLGIVSAGHFYVLDLTTDVLTEVTLPFSNAGMIAFLDGYGLINQVDSPIVWYTNLEDFTVIDALDFFARSGTSDNITAIAVTRDRVWTIGNKTTTQFYDSGDADTPFLPYPGTTVRVGIIAAQSLIVFNDILYWIAQSDSGVATVVRATDPSTETISTPPIALFLDNCPSLADAELLAYGEQEHIFIAMTCPSSTDDVKTYVYDEREQLWHARAGWDERTGTYTRWRSRGCVESTGNVFVGDYANGHLYTLNHDTYTDNGTMIMRERIAPYASNDASTWLFVNEVQLGIQAGVGLSSGQGSDPQVELLVSRDGAHTWISAGFASLGKIGEYAARAIWRRLGRFRADLMVLRVRQSDPVKCVWGPGMFLNITPGTGQL